jgi:hypothetical protein
MRARMQQEDRAVLKSMRIEIYDGQCIEMDAHFKNITAALGTI